MDSSGKEINTRFITIKANSLEVHYAGHFFLTVHLACRLDHLVAYPQQATKRTNVSQLTQNVNFTDAAFRFDPTPILGSNHQSELIELEEEFAPPLLAKQSSDSDDSDPNLLSHPSRYQVFGTLVVTATVFQVNPQAKDRKHSTVGVAKVSLYKLASLKNLRLPVVNETREMGEVDISFGEEVRVANTAVGQS